MHFDYNYYLKFTLCWLTSFFFHNQKNCNIEHTKKPDISTFKVLISSSKYGIKYWNPDNGSIVNELKYVNYGLCISELLKNGNLVNIVNENILVLNNTLGVVIKNISLSKFGLSSVQELSDSTLAISDFNANIHILSPTSGKLIRSFSLNSSSSSSTNMKLLNNGNLAVSFANEVRILNTADGRLERVLVGQKEWVSCMELLKNGLLAVGSDDRRVKIWNTTTGGLIRVLFGFTSSIINFLKVLDDGSLAISSGNVEISIWNPNTGELLAKLTETDYVYSMESLNNGRLAVGSIRKIKIWNIRNGKLVSVFNAYQSNKEDDAYAVMKYAEIKYIKPKPK